MGQSLNVVGMLRTPQLCSALAEVCTDMNGTRFDLRVVPLAQVAADPALPACDLIMVEVDPRDATEMELLRRLVEGQPSGTAIVATTAAATPDALRGPMPPGGVDGVPTG